MEFNVLKFIFVSMTLAIVVVGNLMNFIEHRLPTFIVQSFRYGKFAYTGATSFKLVEVPKRWFKHFYLFSSFFSLYALYLAIDVYLYNAKLPDYIFAYLDFFCGSNRAPLVDPLPTMLALTLMSLQCVRRFYETWFVSVFSEGKMNLSHYMVGFIHYWGAITFMLSEAKGFTTTFLGSTDVRFQQLNVAQVAGTLLFFYAWYYQFQCAIILANLRKNKNGQVVSSAHKIPKGGLFEYLSSPHLSCEILIYLALLLVLRQSSSFAFVTLWVLSNQVETALLSHWWYKKTFSKYPAQRKALIPFVL